MVSLNILVLAGYHKNTWFVHISIVESMKNTKEQQDDYQRPVNCKKFEESEVKESGRPKTIFIANEQDVWLKSLVLKKWNKNPA